MNVKKDPKFSTEHSTIILVINQLNAQILVL